MNMGFENHYIDVNPETTPEIINENIDIILPKIDIKKHLGIYNIVSVFVKAHKYDVMPHGSSAWKQEEILKICKHIVDKVFESFE